MKAKDAVKAMHEGMRIIDQDGRVFKYNECGVLLSRVCEGAEYKTTMHGLRDGLSTNYRIFNQMKKVRFYDYRNSNLARALHMYSDCGKRTFGGSIQSSHGVDLSLWHKTNTYIELGVEA